VPLPIEVEGKSEVSRNGDPVIPNISSYAPATPYKNQGKLGLPLNPFEPTSEELGQPLHFKALKARLINRVSATPSGKR
jgi:hypothetical protein